jgi:hypothetical protein
MINWIHNPISYRVDNPKLNPKLNIRVYELLVNRGIEVIRILDRKRVLSYLYYYPKKKSLKCNIHPRQNGPSKYEWFRIQDIIYIGIFQSNTLYILLSNQCLIFSVDTSNSSKILKQFFDNLIENTNYR